MKKFLLLLALLFLNISFGQSKNTTYYFIRHAEKVDSSQNPDLSEKGLKRLWDAYEILQKLNYTTAEIDEELDKKVNTLVHGFDECMNDDFNTARVLANMF